MPCFVIVNGGTDQSIVDLNRSLFRIGRSATLCDCVIDHPSVSRQHLLVRCDGARTFVMDNNSHNGTYLNGERLHGERELLTGDVLVICDIELRFHAEAPANQLAQ